MRDWQKRCLTPLFLVFCGLMCQAAIAQTVFYMDSEKGSDNADGRSPEAAWKTISAASQHTFTAGEKLLFKAGLKFSGTLTLRGSGTKDAPITVGRFGEGPVPVIDGGGAYRTILLDNGDHWIIEDLEITNRHTEVKPRHGIQVHATRGGAVYGLALRRLHIHHVSGHDERGGGSGILIVTGRNKQQQMTRYEGVLIEHCCLHDLPFNGIFLVGWDSRGRSPDGKLINPSKEVMIRYNLLHDIAGDGICILNTQDAVIEHNELYRGSTGQLRGAKTPSAGIWPHTSDRTIMRYNRVEGLRGNKDGQAFDVDINCRDTLLEYNLSRNNGTGFLLVCSTTDSGNETGPTLDTIVRNNMSLDDAAEAPGALFTFVSSVKGITCTNNVFSITRPGTHRLLHCGNWMDNVKYWPKGMTWSKNLFLTAGPMEWTLGESKGIQFDHNIWQGTFPGLYKDKTGFYGNPGLVKQPIYTTWDAAVKPDSEAIKKGFQPFSLVDVGLPKDSPWLVQRDESLRKNPSCL